MTNFCLMCGLPLDKEFRRWNKNFQGWEGPNRKYCNETCSQRKERESRPKNRKKAPWTPDAIKDESSC